MIQNLLWARSEPVNDNAVEPVYDLQKEQGLEVCGFEIPHSIPHADDQDERRQDRHAEANQKPFSLSFHCFRIGQAEGDARS